MIQNSPAGPSAQNIGPYAGGLNYNALPNSIGIELDTFKNVYEKYADEITITVNGVMVTPVATTASPFDLNNGQSYNVWVDYDGENNMLSVFISDTNDKPQDAVLTANLELDQIVGDQAYFGFAAATGTAFNNTYIESLNVQYEDPVPTPGFFTLVSDAFSVNESSGSITIDVERVGGSAGAASIQYSTTSGSAGAGDFVSASGTLNFADGDTRESITINLINDAEDEGTESFSLALSNPQGGAGVLSPDVSTINILDDDGAVNPNLPNYSSFGSADGLQLNGNATVTGGELRLVAAAAQQRGSAYYTTPIAVDSDTSFQARFAARFDGGQGSGGGEGLAFVIQNSPAGTAAQNIGPYAGGLNYNAVTKSIGIELDTFKNVYEQYADEITITVNGVMVTPVATVASPFDLNNGQTYNVWVDYDGASNLLSVFLSNTNQKPGSPVLTANLDLNQIVGNQAYMGFAAATGTAFNNAYIESWNVTADGVDPPDPTPGNFALASGSFSVNENNGPITVNVQRLGGSSGAASVQYFTTNGSATAGSDFGPISGTLNFADGETSRSLTISITDDGNDEVNESFTLSLASPTVAGLTSPTEATITIIDNDTSGSAVDTTDDGLGTITAQGEIGSFQGREKAFDNIPGSKWLDFADQNPSTRASWIQYQYAENQQYVLTSYTITSGDDNPMRDPKDWTISGSNDGVNFTAIDTRSDEFFRRESRRVSSPLPTVPPITSTGSISTRLPTHRSPTPCRLVRSS